MRRGPLWWPSCEDMYNAVCEMIEETGQGDLVIRSELEGWLALHHPELEERLGSDERYQRCLSHALRNAGFTKYRKSGKRSAAYIRVPTTEG